MHEGLGKGACLLGEELDALVVEGRYAQVTNVERVDRSGHNISNSLVTLRKNLGQLFAAFLHLSVPGIFCTFKI